MDLGSNIQQTDIDGKFDGQMSNVAGRVAIPIRYSSRVRRQRRLPLQINYHSARARLACVSTVTIIKTGHKDTVAMIDHTAECRTDGNILIVNGILGVPKGQDGVRKAAVDVVYRHVTA